MYRWFVLFFLVGLSTGLMAGALSDPAPPVTKHIEIAGTLVIGDDGALVLKSNGHEYVLTLDAAEPGVATLKSGMALIVKGTLTITDGPGDEKSRALRPDEMIIRGRSFQYATQTAP